MTSATLAGVNEDVETLLYKFVNQKSYSFATFSEVWKKMQFYYIYCGRPTILEMKIFTRELFLIVKSHALSDCTVWERSGAIFLLYSLYFSQPLSNKVPIRIEQNEWNQLQQFAQDMKTVNLEVSFCFCKLVVNNAFDFVYSNKQLNIESMKEDDPPKTDILVKTEKKYKYDKFAMGSLLTSIGFDPHSSAEREEKYNDIKTTLNEKFPDLCNFEIRRFGVNLLVPPVVIEEQPTTEESTTSTRKRKKKPSKKNKTADLSLFSEEDLLESTLSMPALQQDDDYDINEDDL